MEGSGQTVHSAKMAGSDYKSKPNKTYPKGRKCWKCGCVLSIYNPERYCSVHSDRMMTVHV